MESPRGLERPSGSDGPLAPVTGNRVQRVARHTQHLVDDVKEWVDLRIELAQIELEERAEAKVNQIALQVAVAGILLLAVVFGLVTIALALGAWLGHAGWGFLIVTLLLVALAVVLREARPEFIQIGGHARGTSEPSTDGSVAAREPS